MTQDRLLFSCEASGPFKSSFLKGHMTNVAIATGLEAKNQPALPSSLQLGKGESWVEQCARSTQCPRVDPGPRPGGAF